MDSRIRILSFVLALVVIPAAFAALCTWMARKQAYWVCYPAYFFLFGIAGGGCIALGLSPSGLAALCILLLITAAPVACFLSSAVLNTRQNRGRFENMAMILGYAYSGLIITAFLVGQLFYK